MVGIYYLTRQINSDAKTAARFLRPVICGVRSILCLLAID